ncbi:MAG: protein IcmL (DotI) [Gammaproteobacteria bacterium]|jgi:intracellular multiplication protein IcmL|nr:protein IcmL (DotI) [Gammaproteobacteria bacterium]
MAEEKQAKKAAFSARKSAIEIVRLRNNYYRDSYRFLMGAVLALVVLCVLMMVILFYLYTTRPAPRYFATNVIGGLVEIQPLTSPSLSDAALLAWSSRAATAAFTLNYAQYQQQLEQTKNTYFTPTGGQNFLDAIKASLNLETLLQGFFVMTAEVVQAPTILQRGIVNTENGKAFSWQVNVPIRVRWTSQARTFSNMYNVVLTVVRSSPLIDPVARQMNLDSLQGIGVLQFVAQTLS